MAAHMAEAAALLAAEVATTVNRKVSPRRIIARPNPLGAISLVLEIDEQRSPSSEDGERSILQV